MNEEIKRRIWDVIRPLHSPVTKSLRRRLGRNYFEHPEMELPPPYDAIQLEVERRLHHYLHVSAKDVSQIILVGANDGGEIHRIRQVYARSRFLCFEPSPSWYQTLTKNFAFDSFVEARKLALSDHPGTATFHELPLGGNGSLLAPDRERWSAFNKVEENEVTSFDVQLSTLDHETIGLDKIDLLWVDVQGAEAQVLRGGTETLKRVAAIFLEVAIVQSPYEGAPLFAELDATLVSYGFRCVGLGTDSWNYAGNALWIRDLEGRIIKGA